MTTSTFDELPTAARKLVDAARKDLAKLDAKLEKDSAKIRAAADAQLAALKEEIEAAQRERQGRLAEALKPLMQQFAKDGLLDEALAIRDEIRKSRRGGAVQPGPERMTCRREDVGKEFLFEVVGATNGRVWGTDVYTADSALAATCVHAGAVEAGERAVVRVKVLDTSSRAGFEATSRHGVTSEAWGAWALGFSVARA